MNGYVEDDVFVYPSCPTLNNFHQDIFQSELEEFCSNFDCSGDASEVASAVYDLLPDGTRSALSNGRFFQSGCFNFDSILSESVNAGDYSGAVLPLMNLLSRWVPASINALFDCGVQFLYVFSHLLVKRMFNVRIGLMGCAEMTEAIGSGKMTTRC